MCKAYVKSFEKYYHGNGMPLYASKALSCKELCRIAKEEGLGLDVVSGGEIYTAVQAGFPMEKVHFHGNNKTADEIRFALESNVGSSLLIIFTNLNFSMKFAVKWVRRLIFLLELSPV